MKMSDAERRRRAAERRREKIDRETQAAIAASAAMTPEEIAHEVATAWSRTTDPEMVAAELAARGRPPLKAKNGKPARPIVVVSADGKPIKIVPSSQLLQALLDRQGVEDATVEAKRPKRVRCIDCRAIILVSRSGHIPSRCKSCLVERKREQRLAWREKNREKSRESSRAWREKNPEKARENYRAWCAKNPEKHRERCRVWRAKNPEKHRERVRAWRAKKKS